MAKIKKIKSTIPQPVSEIDWRGRCDAQTLAEAQVILNDNKRLAAAAKAAKKMAEAKEIEAKAMKKVARKA